MNDPNLENQLRSWTPRRPSASLEQRIFERDRPARAGAGAGRPADLGSANRGRSWLPLLASPLGVGLAVMALIASLAGLGRFATSPVVQNAGPSLLASVAISNQDAPAYLTVPLHSEHNTWFKSWTFTSIGTDFPQHPHASNTSFPVWITNLYR